MAGTVSFATHPFKDSNKALKPELKVPSASNAGVPASLECPYFKNEMQMAELIDESWTILLSLLPALHMFM